MDGQPLDDAVAAARAFVAAKPSEDRIAVATFATRRSCTPSSRVVAPIPAGIVPPTAASGKAPDGGAVAAVFGEVAGLHAEVLGEAVGTHVFVGLVV